MVDSGFVGTIIVGIAFLAMATIVGRRLNKGKTREQRASRVPRGLRGHRGRQGRRVPPLRERASRWWLV